MLAVVQFLVMPQGKAPMSGLFLQLRPVTCWTFVWVLREPPVFIRRFTVAVVLLVEPFGGQLRVAALVTFVSVAAHYPIGLLWPEAVAEAVVEVSAAMVALLPALMVHHLPPLTMADKVVLERLNQQAAHRVQDVPIVVRQMVVPEPSASAAMAVEQHGVTVGTAPVVVAVTTAAEAAVLAVTVAPVAVVPVGSVHLSPATFHMHWRPQSPLVV